jgi:DNA-binding NtrC family response regulator
MHKTETRDDSDGDSAPATPGDPQLMVAMSAHQPTAAPRRIPLAELDELQLGRQHGEAGDDLGATPPFVALADDEASRAHAVLRRTSRGWTIRDLDSKNGTFVNATRITEAVVQDGDVIEIGRSFLVFRDGHTGNPVAETPRLSGTLATLNIDLERQFSALAQIATSMVPVLLRGATGTGKEVAARAIHELSRRPGAFVAVNCGALPRTLIESELFGYRRGAFSGAGEDRDGLVRRAHGGTLFLDEIGDLPLDSQVALLRVLQEGELRPVGATSPLQVDVRVIAATNQDLERHLGEERLRQDLYARLAGFVAMLPPLCDRREDLGLLVAALLPRLGAPPSLRIHRRAARALFRYGYPLNIRELQQALRAALALSSTGEIRLEHLPDAIRNYVPPTTPTSLGMVERTLLDQVLSALREHHGNVAAVSRALNTSPVQIRRWCTRFGIDLATFRT